AASTSARWETSQRTAIARLLIAAAAAREARSSMSTKATRAPSRANVSAMPLPKPEPAPVTSATLLSRRMSFPFQRHDPGWRPCGWLTGDGARLGGDTAQFHDLAARR